MILSKLIVGQVVSYIVKQFKLDKIKSYVFDDNELDKKVKNLESKVDLLEKLSHAPREFVLCNECKKQIKGK